MATISLRPDRTEESEHYHNWYLNPDSVSWRCANLFRGHPCNRIKVSRSELQRREEEWSAYVELGKTTESYRDYVDMIKAIKNGDREWRLQIMERVSKRLERRYDEFGDGYFVHLTPSELIPPAFPDPAEPGRYFVTGD